MYTTLISVDELKQLRASGAPQMLFDCSFDLMNPAAGEEAYRKSHIPGAVYAHLDDDLSDKGVVEPDGTHHPHPDAASGGRHPLPSREKFAMWLSKIGFTNEMQAVVYDRNNSNYCGRLWWMLKWLGHDPVAVLDGGLQAWQAAGGEATDRAETALPEQFQDRAGAAPARDHEGRARASGSRGPDPRRCARAAALSRRGRTDGPGRGTYPGRA